MKRLMLIVGAVWLAAAPAAAQGPGTTPTWNHDVAPIVFANCITCHRPGEVAPMSLLTYQESRPWAKGIKAKVAAHEMPPWFADPRFGKFENKRGLTPAQIATIVAWADAGAPQGTGPAPVAPNLGQRSAEVMDRVPDFVYEGPVEIDIPPNEVLPNIRVWGKVPFAEDKYLEAVENRPSNRGVTHHSSFRAEPLPRGAHHVGVGPLWPGGPLANAVPVREDGTQLSENSELDSDEITEANTDADDATLGNILTFYAPGTGALRFKPGLVKVVRSDHYFTWILHYNATGRPEKDRPAVSLWFSKNPVLAVRSGLANDVNLYEGQEIIGRNVRRQNIPAHAENYRVASLRAIKSDTTLNSLWPHMHLRGKDQTWSVTYPDGREEILLSVPKYSFEWQIQYQFAEAVKLPAGSMLRVVSHYDNSSKNKFNPAPDQELPWGAQSWHEMYFPHFDISIDKDVLKPRTQGTN
jgi:hypothetical protein